MQITLIKLSHKCWTRYSNSQRERELKKKKRPGVLSSSSVETDGDIDDDIVIIETDYNDPQMKRRELVIKKDQKS